jgi:two-component system sensor histidine kinase AgrC
MFSPDVLIIRIISDLLQGLMIPILIALLFNKELKPLRAVCSMIFFAVISTVQGIISFSTASAIFYIIGGIAFGLILAVFIKILFRLNNWQSLLITGIFYLFIYLSQAFAVLILANLNFDLASLTKSPVSFLIGCIVIILLDAAFLLIIKLMKPVFMFPKDIRAKSKILFMINIMISIVIFAAVSGLYVDIYSGYTVEKNSIGFIAVLFLIFFILNIAYMVYFSRQELKNQELEYQKFYNKTLEEIMTDLKRFKHNYSNEIASIAWFIKQKDLNGLSDYILEVQDKLEKVDVQSTLMISNIKNAAIAGLLYAKVQKAHSLGIHVKVNISCEVDTVKMKVNQLCEALGILLDNAVEASEDSEEKILNVVIENTGGVLRFCIENSSLETPDLSKMFLKGWSTKGSGRGLGLWFLNIIKAQNKKTMLNTYIDKNMIKQEFIIG